MNPIMTVRAPDWMQEALTREAARRGIGRNALILEILRHWLGCTVDELIGEDEQNKAE